jgi:hypothetical protein
MCVLCTRASESSPPRARSDLIAVRGPPQETQLFSRVPISTVDLSIVQDLTWGAMAPAYRPRAAWLARRRSKCCRCCQATCGNPLAKGLPRPLWALWWHPRGRPCRRGTFGPRMCIRWLTGVLGAQPRQTFPKIFPCGLHNPCGPTARVCHHRPRCLTGQ